MVPLRRPKSSLSGRVMSARALVLIGMAAPLLGGCFATTGANREARYHPVDGAPRHIFIHPVGRHNVEYAPRASMIDTRPLQRAISPDDPRLSPGFGIYGVTPPAEVPVPVPRRGLRTPSNATTIDGGLQLPVKEKSSALDAPVSTQTATHEQTSTATARPPAVLLPARQRTLNSKKAADGPAAPPSPAGAASESAITTQALPEARATLGARRAPAPQ